MRRYILGICALLTFMLSFGLTIYSNLQDNEVNNLNQTKEQVNNSNVNSNILNLQEESQDNTLQEESQDDTLPEITSYSSVTLADLSDLFLTGSMTADDGVVYYFNYTNVSHHIGYTLKEEQVNSLVEFNIYFENFDVPDAYMTFTLRASGMGHTFSPYLTQNGYTFMIHPTGNLEVFKESTQIKALTDLKPIESGTKHSFKIGAIQESDNIRLLFILDNEVILDYLDEENPIVSNGTCFNICSLVGAGGAGVVAEISPTHEFVCPKYKTYTMGNLGIFPTRSGEVTADIYGNLNFNSGSDTAGYNVNLQNYSFEFNLNFEELAAAGAGLHINLRAKEYARANSSQCGGYGITISPTHFFVFKVGKKHLATVYYDFKLGVDYNVEFGTVDINENQTMIFVNVDGQTVYSYIDNETPEQHRGMILMTCEGNVKCRLSSSYSGISPLKVKVNDEDTEFTTYKIYFNNAFTSKELEYADFSMRNLKSIYINGISVYDWNERYYGKEISDKAIDLFASGTSLTIKISREMHLKSDDSSLQFDFEYLKIQKTKNDRGIQLENGLFLKQSYFYYG